MLWFCVGMYLRFTQRRNADGTLVRYVALAHNRRVDGITKPQVLMNLGRLDRVDVDGLLRLAASIRDTSAAASQMRPAPGRRGWRPGPGPMEVVDARPAGPDCWTGCART